MERSTIQLLAKRGKSQRAIARDLGISRTTVARVLAEPVDREPARRCRTSMVDAYRPQIERWLAEGLSIVRMYELARSEEQQPFTGGRSTFSDRVRQIRAELEREQYVSEVPYRRRERLGEEILATYALLMLHGREALTTAMEQADGRGIYGAEYLEALRSSPPAGAPLHPRLPVDLPTQDAVDRQLETYEAFVTTSAGGSAWWPD